MISPTKKSSVAHSTTPDEIKVLIKNSIQKENIRGIHQVTLKNGPRTYKFATIIEIIDPSTKDTHHYTLRLDSIDRQKAGWFGKPDKSISLSSLDGNEISRLKNFLVAELSGNLETTENELHIVSSTEFIKLQNLLTCLPDLNSSDQLQLVKTILQNIKSSEIKNEELQQIFNSSNEELVKSIAIAAKLIDFKKSYSELSNLINNNESSESKIQSFLESNPWMFGSEYSELLERRKWTRDENLDFMLRRTSDSFLEIIEIKTPDNSELLLLDNSHYSYYPSSKLSKVIGQVLNYIEQIDRDRNSIISKDSCDPLKVRAKIIIGRDGSKEHQDALRSLNAQLHRIEIITFDQLLRIAERVLNIFEKNNKEEEIEENNLPF